MRSKEGLICTLVLVFLTTSTQCRADNYDKAKDATERFINQYEQLRKLTHDEVQQVVEAMCKVDSDELESAGRSASDRLKGNLRDPEEKLEAARMEALQALDRVIADESLKDRRSDAENYKRRVNELWARIERMTESIKGGNHPIVAYMAKAGSYAHKDYQDHHSGGDDFCAVSELEISEGKVDCISTSKCMVVELKPNNSDAVNKGNSQAKRYAHALNSNPDDFKKLVDKDGKAESCKKKMEPKVATYVFCPAVDEDGNFVHTSYGWSDPQ